MLFSVHTLFTLHPNKRRENAFSSLSKLAGLLPTPSLQNELKCSYSLQIDLLDRYHGRNKFQLENICETP